MTGIEGLDNCQKFVEILGLRSVFPLFMKTPKQTKTGPAPDELEGIYEVCFYDIQLRNGLSKYLHIYNSNVKRFLYFELTIFINLCHVYNLKTKTITIFSIAKY